MAQARKNEEKNGIEVMFDAKPSDDIRASLKKNGFRWSRKQGLWYARSTSERWQFALSIADATTDVPMNNVEPEQVLEDWTVMTTEAYMGAVGFEGSKCRSYSGHKELTESLRKDLRDVLPIPRSHVHVRFEWATHEYSIDVTLKLERDKFSKDVEEYRAAIVDGWCPRGCGDWIPVERTDNDNYPWLEEPADKAFYGEGVTAERQRELKEVFADYCVWRYFEQDESLYGLWRDKDRGFDGRRELICPYNDKGQKVCEMAGRIVDAYNYSDTNSMVDYFDRGFYESYKVKWL